MDLNQLSRADLEARARRVGVRRAGRLTRGQLIRAIRQREAAGGGGGAFGAARALFRGVVDVARTLSGRDDDNTGAAPRASSSSSSASESPTPPTEQDTQRLRALGADKPGPGVRVALGPAEGSSGEERIEASPHEPGDEADTAAAPEGEVRASTPHVEPTRSLRAFREEEVPPPVGVEVHEGEEDAAELGEGDARRDVLPPSQEDDEHDAPPHTVMATVDLRPYLAQAQAREPLVPTPDARRAETVDIRPALVAAQFEEFSPETATATTTDLRGAAARALARAEQGEEDQEGQEDAPNVRGDTRLDLGADAGMGLDARPTLIDPEVPSSRPLPPAQIGEPIPTLTMARLLHEQGHHRRALAILESLERLGAIGEERDAHSKLLAATRSALGLINENEGGAGADKDPAVGARAELVALALDGRRVLLAWGVSDASLASARQLFGAEGDLVLRVSVRGPVGERVPDEVAGARGERVIGPLAPGSYVTAGVGLRHGDRFASVASSTVVEVV